MKHLSRPGRIDVANLMLPLHQQLVTLLRGLGPEEWLAQTVAPLWKVRDVVAHLLDGDLRRLAMQRDGHFVALPESIDSYGGVVEFLNDLNATWVSAAGRLSPRQLVDLVDRHGQEAIDFLSGIDLDSKALFPVAWAGENESLHWFDLAREYTEKWHHQQQIRAAVGQETLTDPKWLRPVYETFLRGLPRTFLDCSAVEGSSVNVVISGSAGGGWSLVRDRTGWALWEGQKTASTASVTIEENFAWRIFTKGVPADDAWPRVRWSGEERLARKVLELVAIMG